MVLSIPEVGDKSENMSLFSFLVCQVQAILVKKTNEPNFAVKNIIKANFWLSHTNILTVHQFVCLKIKQ